MSMDLDLAERPALDGAVARLNTSVIENLDVTIDTFLGATSITVAQLNALRVGSILALDASLSEMVELRLNGVVIAHGELVAVGDKFGVRIVSVSP